MNTNTINPKDLLGVTKPQLDLVPSSLIIHVAKAMENGAAKYGPYNWRDKKVRATIYIAAAQRHLLSLLDGEDFAQDSGVHHAAHAAACMGIILDALECDCLIDDRPTKGNAAAIIERLTVKKPAPATPPKKKVYIAGPMRGIKDFNFPAFFEAEEKLRARGYEVFNPARRDEEHYGAGITKIASGSEEEAAAKTGFNIREALGADCDWITKHADMVVFLPGWENSTGCQAEHALAVALHLEIKTLHEMLCNEDDSMFWNELDHKP
jgi:dATP/dGTP diphosphohydrolase/uncharacterized protein DUF4406